MEQLLASESEANTVAQFLKACSFGEVELESGAEEGLSVSVSNRCPLVRNVQGMRLGSYSPFAPPVLGCG